MPPRRAAAAKAAEANKPAAAKKAPAAKAPPKKKAAAGKKRAHDEVDDEDQNDAEPDAEPEAEEDDEEEAKPKKKKAKTAKTTAAASASKSTRPVRGAAKKAAEAAASQQKADDDEDDDAKMDDAKKSPTPPAKSPTPPPAPAQASTSKPDPPPKTVTVVQRGAAPVDSVSGLVSTHQVLAANGEVYDAMLNQTDIKKNANKFYVIQLLHPIGNTSSVLMFTRWGRTGEDGQTQRKGPFGADQAVKEFEKQFKSKTAANWAHRKTMVRKDGKYFWIERDFEEGDKKDDNDDDDGGDEAEPNGKGKGKEVAKVPDSTAPEEVQNLIRLIFNTTLMDAHLKELNYDANKLPLGKLSKATILQGFSVLKTLSEVINAPNGDLAQSKGGWQEACQSLSGDYYSIIPHAFGRHQRPITINSQEQLKRELDLVDALGDMTIASKLLSSSTTDEQGNSIHPIDARLHGLNLKTIEPLAHTSKEFKALERYTTESHGKTHGHLQGAQVQAIFKIEREGEEERYNKAGYDKLEDGNRMLLWHGSRTTNFGGILSQGLRIAPPEAPVSGYMFGKGVYFADASSKSLGYTHHHLSENTGLLLLCEVATKPVLELQQAAYDADQLCKKANALATKGCGTFEPGKWGDVADLTGNEELRGVVMPQGPLEESAARKNLWYNEYIVYDVSQIRVRYLLRVKFPGRGW